MRRISILFIVLGLISLSSASSRAQRALGAKSLVLDDGSGNTLTISYPNTSPTVAGNSTLTLSGGATFTASHLNAYSTTNQAITNGSSVAFASGITIAGGFTVTPSFDNFAPSTTGIYNVDFACQISGGGNVAITVNGVVQPGASFGTSSGTPATVSGIAILSLNAGDVVRLINNYGSSISLIPALPGSTTASIRIVRIQ